VAVDTRSPTTRFDPGAFEQFRFTSRELDEQGRVTLRYALDDELAFEETYELPLSTSASELTDAERQRVEGLLALLHWVAGVSYYKTALPPEVSCEAGVPPPAVAELLEALYSEGLAELAYTNALPGLPRPTFDWSPQPRGGDRQPALAKVRPVPTPGAYGSVPANAPLGRVLVPVGGGKDSAVALEIVRRSGRECALFSIGDAPPIARTAAVAGLPHLIARRKLDPTLRELNAAGAINGHVPITAIVTCVALLTAALNGFDAVAMANERSASAGNVMWDGVDVNHQFSKGLRAERLLSAALAELADTDTDTGVAADAEPARPDAGTGALSLRAFSVLRPASELAIARAFARMEGYHDAFTSCNAVFRLDATVRASSWCCECPKCRFVFLALAPFSEPAHLREVFGRDLLADEGQFDGFALLSATGGHKPFECVGEEQESVAAMRLLARDPRWREHSVVRRLAAEVLSRLSPDVGDPDAVLTLSDEHELPAELLVDVHAVLGA
jgi:UDP-N-acetyl-alpha-D-muramoyl-L-alanyl-L-glutamate epimerase